MTSFESFDSIEDMFATMAKRHAHAMAHLDPRQRALLPKTDFYWIRPMPEMGVCIFGHHDLEASIALEKRLTPEDEMYMHEGWAEDFKRRNIEEGFKYGYCYSPIEPEGELGSTHVSTMVEISKEAFEEAKQIGWDITRITPGGALAKELERIAGEVGQ